MNAYIVSGTSFSQSSADVLFTIVTLAVLLHRQRLRKFEKGQSLRFVVMYFYVLCQAFDYTPIPISPFVYPNIIALFPPSLRLFQLLFNGIYIQWTEIVSLLELYNFQKPT